MVKIKKGEGTEVITNKNSEIVSWKHPGGKFRRIGPSYCNEEELLTIIIATGNSGRTADKIAQEIIDKYGTISDLMGISLKKLMQIKGLKAVKATQIAAVFEIARRIVKHLEKE